MLRLGVIVASAAIAISASAAQAACGGSGGGGGGVRTGTTGHASGGVSAARIGVASSGCQVGVHASTATTIAKPTPIIAPKAPVAMIHEHTVVKQAPVHHASTPAMAHPAVLRTHRG